MGLSIIVVHGGGPRIKRELDKKKIVSKFINGLRVTYKNIIDTVEKVLIDFIIIMIPRFLLLTIIWKLISNLDYYHSNK